MIAAVPSPSLPLRRLAISLLIGPLFGYGQTAPDRLLLPEYTVIPAAPVSSLAPAQTVVGEVFTRWTRSQGDNGSRRYSALNQINRENVRELEMAWTYRSNDGAANIQCTPIIVEGVLFAPTPGGALVAVNAVTGVELWRRSLIEPANGNRLQDTPARRGLVYWPGDSTAGARLLVGAGDWIYALDARSGSPIPGFGERGRVALPTGATAAPAVCRGVIVAIGLYGDAFGYDVVTGKTLWRFRSVAQESDVGADTWRGPQSGANGWSGLSVDDERGLAFVAFGAPRPDMVGVGRIGDNLFSNCVVALDVVTGKRRWHFQDVRHDIWDLDVCAPPNLLSIEREGRRVDVVTSLSKAGHLFVLDRETGASVFPIRLRRAPASLLPGEATAEYQPDPEIPEPLSSMAFGPADITERTPAAHEFVRKVVENSSYGFFPPHVEGKPTLYIGSRGGAEWSGAAVDVPSGRLYVTSNRLVSKITVIGNDERGRDPRLPPSAGEKQYIQHCAPCHGPDRLGVGMVPPLLGLKKRLSDEAVMQLLDTGRGAMPPNHVLDAKQRAELLDFLFRRNQPGTADPDAGAAHNGPLYTFAGFGFLTDDEGYPGIKPPWGLLNCYDLNTGKVLWRVPLGEIEALTKLGVPKTGSQNLGGATVTAGGLVFVAGTADQLLRAFDADTGAELWAYKLPFAGSAAPAVYEVNGQQFVVITATGGGRVGGPAGDAYVAFRLPAKKRSDLR